MCKRQIMQKGSAVTRLCSRFTVPSKLDECRSSAPELDVWPSVKHGLIAMLLSCTLLYQNLRDRSQELAF